MLGVGNEQALWPGARLDHGRHLRASLRGHRVGALVRTRGRRRRKRRAPAAAVGVPGRGDLVVTDTYAKEHAAFGLEAGEAALRVLSGGDREAWLGVFPVAAFGTMPTDVWRCDAHPAFDVKGRRLALNVWVRGSRRVASPTADERGLDVPRARV